MTQKLGMIHTGAVLVPLFKTLAKKHLPGLDVIHMVDESLIGDTIAAGRLTKATTRRLALHINSCVQAGATSIMVTCSSIGPAAEAARAFFDEPIYRVDEPMARAAVQSGPRIGVLATLSTTLDPTVSLIQSFSNSATVTARLCQGAFDAVMSGDTDTHDRLVSSALRDLAPHVDVIVLAQASMARVVDTAGAFSVPILSSPELAIIDLKAKLEL